jgi:hypothetical protein
MALDREDIRALLEDLNAELESRGARADVFLVGGAAITVAYDARRSTRDLDAVFQPTAVVREAALAVAARRNITADWLNDAVKGFLPGPDPDAQRYYTGSALTVDVASAHFLLAMKLFASRVELDAEDIAFLYRQVGYTTVGEGLELVATTYRGRPIPAKVQFLLEEIVATLDDGDAGGAGEPPA